MACYNGLKQKFEQNPHLKDALLETGNKILVEASYDDILGTGIPLAGDQCLSKPKSKSYGILGRILMHI